VVKTDSGFMMYYTGQSSGLQIDQIGLATSSDGLSFTRYSQNPVVTFGAAGEWDHDSVNEQCVIYEAGQYKMWYSGQTYTPSAQIGTYQIGYATSPDGIKWTKYSGNPIFTPASAGSWDDGFVYRPMVFSTGSSYTMYYVGTSKANASASGFGIATSSDGIHWTRSGVMALPPQSNWDAYRQRITSILKVEGGYLMAYSGWGTGATAPAKIGLATSTDGLTWTPYPDNPVIAGIASSTWESGGVNNPMVIPVGGNYYVYYSAFPQGGSWNSVGLAILPMSQYPVPEYPSALLVIGTAILLSVGGSLLLRRRRVG